MESSFDSLTKSVEVDLRLQPDTTMSSGTRSTASYTSSEDSSVSTERLSPTLMTPLGVPRKPKRPLTAYNYFFQSERQKLLFSKGIHDPTTVKRHGKISFADLAREVSVKWKMADPETKSSYVALACRDKMRYLREMKEWKTMKGSIFVKPKTVLASSEGLSSASHVFGHADDTQGPLSRQEYTLHPRHQPKHSLDGSFFIEYSQQPVASSPGRHWKNLTESSFQFQLPEEVLECAPFSSGHHHRSSTNMSWMGLSSVLGLSTESMQLVDTNLTWCVPITTPISRKKEKHKSCPRKGRRVSTHNDKNAATSTLKQALKWFGAPQAGEPFVHLVKGPHGAKAYGFCLPQNF